MVSPASQFATTLAAFKSNFDEKETLFKQSEQIAGVIASLKIAMPLVTSARMPNYYFFLNATQKHLEVAEKIKALSLQCTAQINELEKLMNTNQIPFQLQADFLLFGISKKMGDLDTVD